MSRLRSTVPSTKAAPSNGTAYLMAYNAVKSSPGLIHGALDGPKGSHCAIGWMFAKNNIALYDSFVDEVAMVNDSVPPALSVKTRRRVVLRWLEWKLKQIGMPGFEKAAQP
jgi:hypothetical protein